MKKYILVLSQNQMLNSNEKLINYSQEMTIAYQEDNELKGEEHIQCVSIYKTFKNRQIKL